VIVLDVMLPGLNGFRVCAHLREAGVRTPILMLTAKDGEYDEAEGLETGADDYLTKPFSFVVLMARLGPGAPHPPGPAGRPALRRPRDRPGRAPLPPRGAGRRADRPRVRRAGHLADRVGETVRKSDILDAVWDDAATTPTSTSSRCTSARFAARSTSRSAGPASRPSAASATGCA
jgi:CheY-like chemotaxis protein